MSSRRLKIAVHDHNRRSLPMVNALMNAGHDFVEDEAADVFLIDLDPPLPLPHRREIDAHKRRGAKIVVYPHGGGGPILAYDGLYAPYKLVDANLVTGPGHAEFLRRIRYPHPTHVIGWSFCQQRAFRPREEIRRVLFAPTHPNADGSMAEPNRALNADVYRRLLDGPWDVVVRHIGTLEENGLWPADGPEFINGSLFAETHEIDVVDAVIAGDGTFPCLAIARGTPAVMYGQAAGSSLGLPGEKLVLPQRGDRYLDYIRYPFDAADGPLEETFAAAGRSEAPIADFKRRFIGRPFDQRMFVGLIERIAAGAPAPVRIDATKRFTTLAFADELMERPELLADYVAQVTPEDDASLILWAPGADGQLLLSMAQAAIDGSGIDGNRLPDMLLAPLPGSPEADQRLAERADAVLGEWPAVGRIGKLPRFEGVPA